MEGKKFTLSNRKGTPIFCILYKFIINNKFIDRFPNVNMVSVTSIILDRCLIGFKRIQVNWDSKSTEVSNTTTIMKGICK